jgi:hypothetical protein
MGPRASKSYIIRSLKIQTFRPTSIKRIRWVVQVTRSEKRIHSAEHNISRGGTVWEAYVQYMWGAVIVTGYGLDDRGVGVRVPVGARIVSSPQGPDRLWGPPSLLSNGYHGLLRRLSGQGVKLTTPKICWGQEYVDLYLHSPIRLHGIVLN